MVPLPPAVLPVITLDLTRYRMQEAHHQDPEELYVKQDRIGAGLPHECARALSH